MNQKTQTGTVDLVKIAARKRLYISGGRVLTEPQGLLHSGTAAEVMYPEEEPERPDQQRPTW